MLLFLRSTSLAHSPRSTRSLTSYVSLWHSSMAENRCGKLENRLLPTITVSFPVSSRFFGRVRLTALMLDARFVALARVKHHLRQTNTDCKSRGIRKIFDCTPFSHLHAFARKGPSPYARARTRALALRLRLLSRSS